MITRKYHKYEKWEGQQDTCSKDTCARTSASTVSSSLSSPLSSIWTILSLSLPNQNIQLNENDIQDTLVCCSYQWLSMKLETKSLGFLGFLGFEIWDLRSHLKLKGGDTRHHLVKVAKTDQSPSSSSSAIHHLYKSASSSLSSVI